MTKIQNCYQLRSIANQFQNCIAVTAHYCYAI